MRFNKAYILLFGLLFAAFAVVFNTFPRSTFSELEKRELAVFPKFTPEKFFDGSFTSEVSSWFSDSEPFRDHFMWLSMQVKDLIRFGSISQPIADFLNMCVKIRKNIVISGGTGSGKTTLLNILSGFLPDTERILTIEDAAELQLRQEHVVRLEARPANIEGKGEISIRDLVKNALRMRPDRIVIGECRGGEALDMLQAMNTGHDGSLTTIHANSPRDCLSRLETLVLMAGFDLPLRAIREQIASAISIIVQISREKDGSRKVMRVSEITKMEGEIITMQDIFVFHQDGWTEDGKIRGRYVATGNIPTFMDDIKRAGLNLDISLFTPPKDLKGVAYR